MIKVPNQSITHISFIKEESFSFSLSLNLQFNQSIDRSQSINQSISQSINQSVSQVIPYEIWLIPFYAIFSISEYGDEFCMIIFLQYYYPYSNIFYRLNIYIFCLQAIAQIKFNRLDQIIHWGKYDILCLE